MLGTVLYPRVDAKDAHRLQSEFISRLDAKIEFSDSDLDAALSSPRAFPPTGGRRISEAELRDLRRSCLDGLADASASNDVAKTSSFDLAVGRVLHQAGKQSFGEFGDPYVWDFLTLILLPDLAAKRLAMGSSSVGSGSSLAKRVTGGDRRHVFQRLWKRWLIFGPDIVESGKLTEDDYVATIERLITNRPRLARVVAEAIMASDYSGSDRREYSRVFMRKLQQTSGLVQIRDDDEVYLRNVVEAVHSQTVDFLNLAETSGNQFRLFG